MEDIENTSSSEIVRRVGFSDIDSRIFEKYTLHLVMKDTKCDFCGNFNHATRYCKQSKYTPYCRQYGHNVSCLKVYCKFKFQRKQNKWDRHFNSSTSNTFRKTSNKFHCN